MLPHVSWGPQSPCLRTTVQEQCLHWNHFAIKSQLKAQIHAVWMRSFCPLREAIPGSVHPNHGAELTATYKSVNCVYPALLPSIFLKEKLLRAPCWTPTSLTPWSSAQNRQSLFQNVPRCRSSGFCGSRLPSPQLTLCFWSRSSCIESAILFYYYYHFHGAMEEEPTARASKQWYHIWEFPSRCQLLLSSFCLWSPSPRAAGDGLTLQGMILQAVERSTFQWPSLLSPELEVGEEALSLQLKI